MRRIATLILAGWLVAGTGYARNDAAPADSPPAAAAGEAELTRAERRERRRAEQADEAQAALADTGEQAEDAADDEGLICRRESVVGTHRRVRICTTRAQREAMRESSQELIRDVTRNRGRLSGEGQ